MGTETEDTILSQLKGFIKLFFFGKQFRSSREGVCSVPRQQEVDIPESLRDHSLHLANSVLFIPRVESTFQGVHF